MIEKPKSSFLKKATESDLQDEESMHYSQTSDPQKRDARPGKIQIQGGNDDESTPLLEPKSECTQSWFQTRFPTMDILLRSPRLMTAIGGSFTQVLLVTAFDPILPLFVNRTFGWGPAGGGLIFMTICVPAVLGGLSGALADVYGPKRVSLIGFTLAIPSLGALVVITHDALFMQVLLCVLLTLAGMYLLPPGMMYG